MRFLVTVVCMVFVLFQCRLQADENAQLKSLLNELKTGEAVKKRKAVKQIIALGSSAKAATPVLINVLEKERDSLVRRGAAEALGVVGGDSKSTIAALARALNDSDVEVIAAASTSLSMYGKNAVPALRQALNENDKQVKRYAAEALARIGPDAKDAVPDLIKAYQADGPNMRRGNMVVKASYVQALGAIGPDAKEAIPVFEASLAERNPNRELVRMLNEALRKIKK